MDKISGFVANDGSRVFSKQELNEQDQKLSQKSNPNDNTQESVVPETSIESALSKVHSDGIAEVNRAATQLNGSLSDLKTAKKQVNQEVKVLKKLHTALKSGDQEEVTKLQQQYQKLQESRSDIAKKIDQNNLQRGYKPQVTLGNAIIGKVSYGRVDFKLETPEVDLNSAKSVKAERARLVKEERASIKNQESQVKSNLQKLGVYAQELDQRVNNTVSKDYEARASFASKFDNSQELDSFTRNLAQKITSNVDQSLSVHKLTADSLKLLQF